MNHKSILNGGYYLLVVPIIAAIPLQIASADEASSLKADAQGIEFFEKHIRPLLVERCYECHSGSESEGGLSLGSKAALLFGGDSGAAVIPGKPDESRIVEAVRYQNLNLQMPPKGRLSDAEIERIVEWVKLGAPDPREATEPSNQASPRGMSIAEGRDFWCFQPIADPVVPKINDAAWVRTPVDAFILARLQSAGLEPAPKADKRTLLRRATFDLTGLPPTPADMHDFLADESPAAFDLVIERLLASPQYGVRWGRHWLDVARYADSNGLDENLAFGNAWRYRDYVINAFNQDKPFDQFLVEQVAGDLLPLANDETKIATGFLALGAKVLAEPDREKLEMDTIDEQIDATGKAFFAMSLGCVRCHDHKFDPIKQSDYYALASIFKSTRTYADSNTGAIKHWYEHSFATEPELAELKKINDEIAAKNSVGAKFKNDAVAKLREQAKLHAADYLSAASKFAPSTSLVEVAVIAEPLGLHPRILNHCRLHLEYNKDDPLWTKWHELQSAGQCEQIGVYYRELFAASASDAGLAQAKAALDDNSGFLAVPPQPEFAFDAVTLAEYYRLMEEARLFESAAKDEVSAMGVSDRRVLVSLPIHIRGSHHNLGEPVKRDFPDVMRWSTTRSVFPRNQSGRLELARWMSATEHPLTSRVFVNRVWRWHFGKGIVGSTDNFGILGDRPIHPELLDWLARHFMESGWSLKSLHRLLVSSSVYQMASEHPQLAHCETVDPENLLLSRFRLQRLDAEQIRDAMLAVAGRLDCSLGGKMVPLRNRQFVFNHTSVDHTKYESLRRAAYLPVIRNNLYTLFEQFDFPDPTMPTGDRNSTVVAPQALLMMNDDLVLDSADSLAAQALNAFSQNEPRVEWTYQQTLNRLPSDLDVSRAITFIVEAKRLLADDTIAELRSWSLFCQSLMASNEFFYVR